MAGQDRLLRVQEKEVTCAAGWRVRMWEKWHLGLEGLLTPEVFRSGFETRARFSPALPPGQKQWRKEGMDYGHTSSRWLGRSKASPERPTRSMMLGMLLFRTPSV